MKKWNNAAFELFYIFHFHVLVNKKIGYDKYRKHHAGNAIGGHKGDVHAAQVVWFYNGMLIH